MEKVVSAVMDLLLALVCLTSHQLKTVNKSWSSPKTNPMTIKTTASVDTWIIVTW